MRHSLLLFALIASWVSNGECVLLAVDRKDMSPVPRADTLRPGVAWWQPSGGPFRGLCAEPWSLGLLAVVHSSRRVPAVQESLDTAMPQAMEGTLRVLEIVHAASLPKEIIPLRTGVPGTELFVSIGGSPFEGLAVGDTVMAFLYEYEGRHTFPPGPMLKVRSRRDPVVSSIRRFVASGFSPLAIEADISLWRRHGHGAALKNAVKCHRDFPTPP